MPKSAQYTVNWSPEQVRYLLVGPPAEANLPAIEEEKSWLEWLEEHHAFAFHGRNGQINLLKEKRKRGSEGYWYAYQRHKGQMVKRYVGRSAQLNMERLEELAVPQVDEDDTKRSFSTQSESAGSHAGFGQFEPLLMPKLQLPRLQKGLLPRKHLLELLDKGLEHKLTLIAGPAGYSKTTLVSQWIAERGARADFPLVAYVALDEGDNDPISFWRYIIAACQKFHAGFGKEALDMLLVHRLLPHKPLNMMLTALLNELSQLEQPGLLILDDFHGINSPQVIETLSFFLDHLPTSFHLILLIRGDPPFSVARLRARNELLDIYPPHLGFSLEETRTFFEQELPFTLSPKSVRQIYERLEGWPTGVRLLARALQWSNDEQEIEHVLAAFAGSHWSIQDYFLHEVVHILPKEQQEFLLQTSILPRVSASLCDAIMDREDSARLIAALRGGDLFLAPLDGTGEEARYLSLFAEAMQQEARRQLGDEQLRRIAARASSWYEKHGLLAEAIETGLNAAEFTHAAGLITQFIERKQQDNAPTIPEVYGLKRWVERLPEAELERHPDVCIHYAMTLLFLQMEGPRLPTINERIQHLLQVAEQKWRDANNTAKLAEIFAFRALLARQDGNMLQAMTWAKQALAWLPVGDRTWRNLALTVVGLGEMLDGALADAHEILFEAQILSEQQGNLTYARATRGMLTWVNFEQGKLHHVAEQFRQMQAEARAQKDYDDIARTQLGLAHLAYQWNDLAAAEQAAREALEVGVQMNVEEFQAQAIVRLALIEHAFGHSVQAQQRLTAWLARGKAPDSPHSYQLHREVQAALARIQLWHGDVAPVAHWIASIERREEMLPLLQRQRERLLRTHLLLAQKDVASAIEQLENLCSAALKTGHIYFTLEAQVVLVLAYAQQGAQATARKQLHDLLEITQGEGYLRLFLDEGKAMADLLRELVPHLREKTLLAYARSILIAFDRETGASARETTPGAALLLEPVSPQEQKVLRLLAAGNSNAEIARELVVSVNTVRTQVQSIYRKLNVNTRLQASMLARQLDLV